MDGARVKSLNGGAQMTVTPPPEVVRIREKLFRIKL